MNETASLPVSKDRREDLSNQRSRRVLTSEEQLGKFRKTLNAEHFPYFEVLLKTSRLSGTSLSSEIIAYRTYPGLK